MRRAAAVPRARCRWPSATPSSLRISTTEVRPSSTRYSTSRAATAMAAILVFMLGGSSLGGAAHAEVDQLVQADRHPGEFRAARNAMRMPASYDDGESVSWLRVSTSPLPPNSTSWRATTPCIRRTVHRGCSIPAAHAPAGRRAARRQGPSAALAAPISSAVRTAVPDGRIDLAPRDAPRRSRSRSKKGAAIRSERGREDGSDWRSWG